MSGFFKLITGIILANFAFDQGQGQNELPVSKYFKISLLLNYNTKISLRKTFYSIISLIGYSTIFNLV